ncbi:ATP-grasp domain-containing protein [Streptomyces sp. NPDC060028]|uniref:ATP-grasp domain-containing protein n=1 Tax=Streptomyces sp. NPDC060028 TaxID=3347041 RepID=UPI0036CEF6B1
MTVTDYNIPVVAQVAARFGLPGLSPVAARNCRDKLPDAAGPSGGRSRGPRLPPGDERLRGQPRRPGALVEEYLLGFEVSVESVLVDGERRFLGVTDKALGPHPYFVEMGDTFPSMLSAPVREECTELARRPLEALGHDFGAAHVEVKMTADGPRIVEVNGRVPGAEITRLIREATGVYLQREVVKLHTGRPADLTPTRDRAAASRHLAARQSGTLTGIDGADLAHRDPGVVEVDLEAHPGDPVRPAESNLDLLGYVVAAGDTTGARCAGPKQPWASSLRGLRPPGRSSGERGTRGRRTGGTEGDRVPGPRSPRRPRYGALGRAVRSARLLRRDPVAPARAGDRRHRAVLLHGGRQTPMGLRRCRPWPAAAATRPFSRGCTPWRQYAYLKARRPEQAEHFTRPAHLARLGGPAQSSSPGPSPGRSGPRAGPPAASASPARRRPS